MNPIAQDIINKCINEGTLSLNLSNTGISELILPIEKLQHIHALYLNNNYLDDLPSQVFELPNLSILEVNNNEITKISTLLHNAHKSKRLETFAIKHNKLKNIPDFLGRLNFLRSLDISHNELSALSENIGSLFRLRDLNISNNQLQYLPDSLKQLKLLATLEINNNLFETLPDSIGYLSSLKYLYARNNKISSLPILYSTVHVLSELDLSYNRLETLPDGFFRNLLPMKLSLNHNKFSELPKDFFDAMNVTRLEINYNQLRSLPDIPLNLSIIYLDVSHNSLTYLPHNIGRLTQLISLDTSYNKLKHLPESIGKLGKLNFLTLNNNRIVELPKSFTKLKSLVILILRNNKLINYPDELKSLMSNTTIDYQNNPFLEPVLLRSQRFTKIWKDAPFNLREILKIYFTGFNTFFFERTKQHITFNVKNDQDALGFEFIPDKETVPEQVDALLHEYYEILKSKLQEGANKGYVHPTSSTDPATFFAQVQASNFALNVSQVRLSVESHVANQDVFIAVSKNLDTMEADYDRMTQTALKLFQESIEKDKAIARLETRTEDHKEELTHRRLESQIRASTPIAISMQQQMFLKQEIGNDFDRLRELLHSHLSDFQKQEAGKIQHELDQVEHKQTLTPAEKQSLSKRLMRWVTGATSAMKTAKEAGQAGGELLEQLGKMKEFAEGVLTDPQLAEKIESIKHGLESLI